MRKKTRLLPAVMVLLLVSLEARAASATSETLSYHADSSRRGQFVAAALSWNRARDLHLDPAFHPHIAGHVYAEPLYFRDSSGPGMLLVATENDTVYALDASSGTTLWQRTLGRPVRLEELPCGNINPLGITGTPVIDVARHAVYLDAMMRDPRSGAPTHELFALALANGSTLPGWPVDVAALLRRQGFAFDPSTQNQRGALIVVGKRVYVPYGGNSNDCGRYHGWVIGVSLENPQQFVSWHTRAQGGGIWAPGGIASDGKGLYFATGNTMGARTWGDGEAVFRLPPSLVFADASTEFFAAKNWRQLNAEDADLGGTAPVLFDAGGRHYALALGKDGNAYLLDRDNLGGFGASVVSERVSSWHIITAAAEYPAAEGAMIALEAPGSDCPTPAAQGDLTVIEVSAGARPALTTAWCGAVSGRGAPIVTTTDGRHDPIVWVLGAQGDERLHGFQGDDGRALFVSQILPGLREFATPTVTRHRLYVGADDTVYAFAF